MNIFWYPHIEIWNGAADAVGSTTRTLEEEIVEVRRELTYMSNPMPLLIKFGNGRKFVGVVWMWWIGGGGTSSSYLAGFVCMIFKTSANFTSSWGTWKDPLIRFSIHGLAINTAVPAASTIVPRPSSSTNQGRNKGSLAFGTLTLHIVARTTPATYGYHMSPLIRPGQWLPDLL